MRILTAMVAAAAVVGASMATAPIAMADGIEPPPRRERPAPRPRPRPAPVAPVQESAPVRLAPTPAPVIEDRSVRLPETFFTGPLVGGVGASVNSNAVGGGRIIVSAGGGARVAVAMTQTVIVGGGATMSIGGGSWGGGGGRGCGCGH